MNELAEISNISNNNLARQVTMVAGRISPASRELDHAALQEAEIKM
jgi:hypothetical protein